MNICEAIEGRKLVSFFYKGHHRTLIPAAHGSHKTTGNAVLRAYQVGGTRNEGETPGWGMFIVSDITGFNVLDDVFENVPPGYRQGDSHIAPIHCEL
jgi:hypothetical protein